MPMVYFTEIEQNSSQICMVSHRRLQIAKTILREKNKAEDSTFSDFKLYYKANLIKTV